MDNFVSPAASSSKPASTASESPVYIQPVTRDASHPGSGAAGSEHYLFLDGIRGLAAVWVLLFHLSGQFADGWKELFAGTSANLPWFLQWMRFGRDGVSVFIVLSGFCLMLPVARSKDGQLRGGLGNFVQRRGLRILPAYYASIVLGLALTYLSHRMKSGMGVSDSSDVWQLNFAPMSLILHALLLHNLSAQWVSITNPALWSVALEWQIYFLFALVLLPLWRRFGGPAGLLNAILAVVAVSMVIGYAPLLLPASYNLAWCSWWLIGMFGLGMLGAVIAETRDGAIAELRERTPWGIAFLVMIVVVTALRMALPGGLPLAVSDLLVGIASILFILYLVGKARLYRGSRRTETEEFAPAGVDVGKTLLRLLDARFCLWLGSISYSLYLTHGFVITRVKTFLVARHLSEVKFTVLIWAVSIIGALILGFLFSLAFERPFLSKRNRLRGAAATAAPASQVAPAA